MFAYGFNGPVSRYSECLACGAWLNAHQGDNLECPDVDEMDATVEEIMQGRNTKGFDDFRWERKRSQTKRPQQPGTAGFAANEALKELEKVEAKEVLDQQLTREVHDFFAAATRQAAGIVERVRR